MDDVVIKLFAAVLTDRLTRWACAQKDFLPHEGCLDYSFVLQRVMEDAHNRKKEVIAWLNLADAFGFVPHTVIKSTPAAAFVPAGVIETVIILYEGSTVHVRTREGHTDPIPMLSGVRQSCPLSTILFNLVIDPLVRGPEESGSGFEVPGVGSDDNAFVAAFPSSMVNY